MGSICYYSKSVIVHAFGVKCAIRFAGGITVAGDVRYDVLINEELEN